MSTTLAAILELTDRVQAAIDAGDWQHARELEAQRLASLERLVAQGAGALDLDGILEDLQRRCLKTIGEVHHHRRRVLRDAALLSAGRTAVTAYRDAAPPQR